ncbi:hypothetical protein VITU9109_03775, partial [Vibrio tubiashii ATCC 19109]
APARSCAVPSARLADGEQYTVPSTIDDPTSLEEIEKALHS